MWIDWRGIDRCWLNIRRRWNYVDPRRVAIRVAVVIWIGSVVRISVWIWIRLIEWNADANADSDAASGLGGRGWNTENGKKDAEEYELLSTHGMVSRVKDWISVEIEGVSERFPEQADSTILTQSTNPNFSLNKSAASKGTVAFSLTRELGQAPKFKDDGVRLAPAIRRVMK